MKLRRRLLAPLVAVGAVAAIALAPTAANAAEDRVQARIDAVIAEYGGEQTAANEVTWDDGAIILTVEAAASVSALTGVGTCPSGSYCAYSRTNYLGSRLAFTTCTTGNSVSALGSAVRSIANSRSSGTVSAYNGSTKVLTVAAGNGKNTTATITTLSCS
ncbi:MAG: peptidase inhibitor family I36 protein [Microbacterium sp.]